MSNLWTRFDGIVKADEVIEATSKFTPLDSGDYDVVLEEIIAGESQSGLPMLKGKFRMKDANRIIFYNQMLQNLNTPEMTAVNVSDAVRFISDLTKEDYEFTTLSALADYIPTIPVGIECTLKLTYGKKDLEMKYPKLKIVEPTVIGEGLNDDDTPFS